MLGHAYLAITSGSTGLVLLTVKSMEIIRLGRVEERELIGQRCLVIKGVGKGATGVVRVYDRTGRLNPELWSAESAYEIPEGEEAQVEAMRSIVLLIKPKEC
jgi:membrane protein implicated in regulation of membrane protease activity